MTKKKTEGEQTHARVPKSNSRFLFPSRASVHNLRVREESVDLKKLQNEEEETGGDDEATGFASRGRSDTHSNAGSVKRSATTFRTSLSQWCVSKNSKFFALRSMVATTALLQRVNGYAYIMVAERPPQHSFARPWRVSRCW